MLTGTYVRPSPKELVGETALLLKQHCPLLGCDIYLAQFNNLEDFSRFEYDWAFGWHQFSLDSFEITENDHED